MRIGSVSFAFLLLSGCSSSSSPTSPPSSTSPTSAHSEQPGFPGAGTDYEPFEGSVMSCFYGPSDTPAAALQYKLETMTGQGVVHLMLTLDPGFVDNTYGANAIGWDANTAPSMPGGMGMPGMGGPMPMSGHTFKDLVESDHAQLQMFDGAGGEVLEFALDYLSAATTASSGYANLGVAGGDGKMLTGSAGAIVATMTSLDRNLNERGLSSYTADSPATDSSYTPNAAAPTWDYRVVYEAWVRQDAFGAAGFGSASLTFVHASPSKSQPTVTVTPNPCPPGWGGGGGDGGAAGGGGSAGGGGTIS